MALTQSLVDKTGWGSQGELPKFVKVEISFWEERIDEFSGQLIRKAASIMQWYVCAVSGEYQIGGRDTRESTRGSRCPWSPGSLGQAVPIES